MADDRRRAEIEQKRAKLNELRLARAERQALLAQGDRSTVEVDIHLVSGLLVDTVPLSH